MLRRLSILGSLLLAACVPMKDLNAPDPRPARMQSAGNELADWRHAQRENTRAAYRNFIRRHPKSRFVGIATLRMKTAVAGKPAVRRVMPKVQRASEANSSRSNY